MESRNRTIVGLKLGGCLLFFVHSYCRNRTIVGLKRVIRMLVITTVSESRNRTIVGLKQECICPALCAKLRRNRTIVGLKQISLGNFFILPTSQSHHSGIETLSPAVRTTK